MPSPVFIAQDLRGSAAALATLDRAELRPAQVHLANAIALLEALRHPRGRVVDVTVRAADGGPLAAAA